MISCFDNYIGMLYVTDAPISGRYINDLPGISTEHFENIRDQSETYDNADAWNVLYDRANRLFESDITAHLKKYAKRYNIYSTSVSHYSSTNDTLSAETKYKGILFEFYPETFNQKLMVENVFFYANSAGTVTVKIFDATLGTELHSTTETLSAGLNKVVLSKEYAIHEYQKLFVCYDDTGTDLFKVIWNPGATYGTASAKAVSTASAVISGNMAADDIGLGCTFSIKCSVDNLVCQRIETFADAFLYKLGVEFFREAKFSDRVNRWTILDRPEIDEAIMELKEEYDKQLKQALESIVIPFDGICFECSKGLTYKNMIP